MPDNTPTTTAALNHDSVDMPKVMALLKSPRAAHDSPVKATTRALRRDAARRYYERLHQ